MSGLGIGDVDGDGLADLVATVHHPPFRLPARRVSRGANINSHQERVQLLVRPRDPQCLEPGNQIGAGGFCVHVPIDEQDRPINTDIYGVARGVQTHRFQYAERFGNRLVRIAEDRVVQFQRLGELCILFDRVDAGRKVRDVKLPDLFAALTERLAFGGSAACESLGEPGDNHRALADVVGQPVGLAVGAHEFE